MSEREGGREVLSDHPTSQSRRVRLINVPFGQIVFVFVSVKTERKAGVHNGTARLYAKYTLTIIRL